MSVQVASGIAYGNGISDFSDAAESITIAAVAAGTRYDAVVLRRDWAGSSTTPTGAATQGRSFIAVVQGGSSQMLPALQNNPGVMTDQPLALVRVTAGQSTVTVTDDLRATYASTAYVRSLLAMTGPLGSQYVLAPSNKPYVMAATTSGTAAAVEGWEPPAPTLPDVPTVRRGTASNVVFSATGAGTITHGLGFDPSLFIPVPRLAAASPLVQIALSSQAGATSSTSAIVTAKRASGGTDGWVPYAGTISYVDWMAMP